MQRHLRTAFIALRNKKDVEGGLLYVYAEFLLPKCRPYRHQKRERKVSMKTTKITRGLVAATLSFIVTATLTMPSAAAAAMPTTIDFSGGTWNGETGFPQDDMGGTGIDGAVGDLGGGLTVTVNYAEVGTATTRGRDGTTYGNLNMLDAAAVADLANPGVPLPPDCYSTTDFLGNEGTPAYGCHETSGLTFNIGSTGANNTATLANYVRYDFTFSQLVTVPNGVTLGDVDSLRILYEDAFPRDYKVDLYQDAIGFELWTDAPGSPGSGVAPTTVPGNELVVSSLDGVSYVHPAAAPLGGRGGLTDSNAASHQVTFTTAEPILGFSIYYWDELADSALDPGVFPTTSIENFEVVPVPALASSVPPLDRGEEPPAESATTPSPQQGALAASGAQPHSWILAIFGLLALGGGALILNRRRT